MPQKTFYLRKEDVDLWAGIKDKARFVHDALHSTDIATYNKAVEERKEIETILAASRALAIYKNAKR